MRQTARVLLIVLALGAGVAAAPGGSAEAATAAPWAFVQVEATAITNPDSLYVPITAYCPSGFTPLSGGISGPGPFTVVNQYSTYWNDSFSEQIVSITSGTYHLTAECAQADQVGNIQVVSADFGRNSSGQAGGWVSCPSGTRVVGGGEDWNLAGSRNVQYAAPSDDGLSWYATGESDTSGNTLHI
jgi:hypothetical protein